MTANDEILGFGAHMDISDIQRAINEIIGGLDKIGIKTDTLSKRMNDAMNEIARSTDDSATKQKHAMDVLAQGVAEAKNALANYPEQLRQAKNEADATAQATARLEAELIKLNSQLSGAVVGSKTYDDLKHSIAGVEQQVANNNALHEAQLTTIQEMEAGYNGLISVYGVAASATGANAIAHGSVAVAVGGEAAAHTENASKIEDETKAVLENKTAKDFQIEGEEKISQAVEQETSAYADLISRMQEGKVSSEEYARILSELRQRISDLRTEAQSINVKIETEQEKLNTSNMVNGQLVSMGDENAVNKLIQQYNVLNGQIGALEGILSSVENAWGRLHGTAKQSQSEITEEVKRTTEAEREMNAEADKQPSGFRVQWNTVNELHHKIRELTSQLREHEAEYDKISEKPGFDTQSKKARELEETIARLRKEIGETKRELEETPKGAGGFLAHWKNRMEDFMTGNGKFQDSLGDMKGALSGLLAPFTAATSGAMNFTKALWAMTATPIGKIISVIVLGLQAIHTYLMKDAEGQRAFAKISAYVGSLLSSITDIAVRIGKYLFHAFSDPQGALNQFGRGLVGMVINPLKAVANTLAGVGQVAKGIIDWIKAGRSFSETQRALGEISKGWESLKKAAGNVTDTVKSVWDAGAGAVTGTYELIKKGLKETWETNLADAGAKMFENARMAATLTEQELDAQKQLSEAKRDEQELEIRIAREREKIYTLTGKEKDAQIEKVKNLLKEKYEPQIAAQQKLLEIQQKRNRLHTVSLEQLSKEREAQTAVYAVQARAASSTRMLVRMQQANLKSMASTSKKDARQQQQIDAAETNYDEVVRKNAMEQAKVMTSLEHALADARISAMKDGEEKYLAEKKRALENELEQLDEQRKDAIEKERENQRKEFEAREKIIKSRGGTTKQWSDDEIDQSAIDAINKKYEELRRLTVARQQQDEYRKQIQAQYDYLKEFGSVQEQKYAIAKEYELKVQEAENEWEKKSLEAEKKRVLEQIDINVLKTEIDWTTIFDGFSDAFQDQIEKTLDKIERYMQTDEFKALDASNKREYINMRNQLNDSKGNKVGTFNFSIYREIGRNLEEYQQALLEEKNAHQQHTLALEALHDADKELKAAEEQVKDAIKSGNADAVSMANVRVAGARVERDNAQSNVLQDNPETKRHRKQGI